MGSSSSYTPPQQAIRPRYRPPPAPAAAAAPPAPDPQLQAQQDAAQQLQIKTVQQGLSTDTTNLLRQFGAASALAGINLASPFGGSGGLLASVNSSGGMIQPRSA